MALYNETREEQSPSVRSAGGGSTIVDWQQRPSAFQQSSQILGGILQAIEQEETKKQKKLTEKFDMYKTLRDSGYEPLAAYEAMVKGEIPNTPPSETTKEKKDRAELAKTEADTALSKSKAAAYDRGDIGKRQASADKMNAAQLQREIKRVSDPFENPDYDSEETKSYLSYLNQKLQQLSQYPGSGGENESAPVERKIRIRRKSDGKTGTVSEKFFDPKKYERA